MKFRNLFYLIHTDILRYARENQNYSEKSNGIAKDQPPLTFLKKISILLLPCVSSITLHRFSHFCWLRKHYLWSRFFWTLNIIFFSAEIIPFSEIGPYFYMPHPTGIGIMGKIGKNATIFLQGCLAGGRKDIDIGGGIGSPVIGDDVVIGIGAKVVGPVRIGNNVTIGPGSLILKNIPDNCVVFGIPARIIRNQSKAPADGAINAEEESEVFIE